MEEKRVVNDIDQSNNWIFLISISESRIKLPFFFFVLYFTNCGVDYEYDPNLPQLIPCAVCEKDVSQLSNECSECEFATSNSIARYKVVLKRKEEYTQEAQHNQERLAREAQWNEEEACSTKREFSK